MSRPSNVHRAKLLVIVASGMALLSTGQTGVALEQEDPAHSAAFPLPPPERGLPPTPVTNPPPEEHFPVPPPPFSDEDIFPCTECHDEEMKVNPERRVLDTPHENIILDHDAENRWCLDCHDATNRDRLHLASGKRIGFDESYKLCGQCHGPTLRDWKKGIHGKRTGMWDGRKEYLLCAHCHDPHSPRFKPLRPEAPPVRPVDIR